MRFYAVIDTNVLVSAVMYKESIPGIVVSHALDGKIVPLVSPSILSEYYDVLRRPKFKFDKRAVGMLIDGLISRGIHMAEIPLKDYFPDPNDMIFYEVVMEARKDCDAYLVTGNLKHFPVRPFIVTAREMLNIIDGK